MLRPVKWRNPYDMEECERIGRETATVNDEPSTVQEQFEKDCDINVMIKRFGLEKVSSIPIDPSRFGDFSDTPDLRTALEIVRDAEYQFMQLPPKVRARFRNSPAELWEFLQDEENVEEAVRLGILENPRQDGAERVSLETPAEGGEPPKGADHA